MEIIKGKVSWVNTVRPTHEDINKLTRQYRLHRLIAEELKTPSARALAEHHGHYLYLVYQFPVYDPLERVSRRGEIDFVITKKEVMTVSYDRLEIIDELKRTLKPESRAFQGVLQLTHKILEQILGFQNRQLTHIREKIEGVSAELFRDRESVRERNLLEKISYLKRDISQYRIIVRPQKHLLESLARVGCEFLGEGCPIYVNDLIGENIKILDQLEDYRQAVEDFESTNIQLITIKNVQVVKTFTILAFLTFPMMLLAALFSMNTRDTPIVELPYSFWIIVGIMAFAMVGMYRYFRKKDWV